MQDIIASQKIRPTAIRLPSKNIDSKDLQWSWAPEQKKRIDAISLN